MFSKPHQYAGAALLVLIGFTGACAQSERATGPLGDEVSLASAVPWSANPELSQLLAAVREATDQFHDVDVAFGAGYRPSIVGCESSAEGAMGVHYGNGALMGLVPGVRPTTGTNVVIDPLRPEVLMYEPHANGKRRLVGIEYVVYRAAWDAAHPGTPPTLLGVPFDQKFGPEAHGHADHYELHVWLWRHNPLGMFAPWNPKVSC
ncbi:MAG TPA: hypothetical protein VFD64_08990 [Gemmatimonadaceae bacterium]|nr:hypothetical protein [Gemmatimonadaceae bacterium]